MDVETANSILRDPYGALAAVLVASVVAGVVMNFVIVRWLKRYTRRTETDYDSIVVDNLHVPLVVTVSLVGFTILTSVVSVADGSFLTRDRVSLFIARPALSIILLAWAFYLIRVVNRIVEKIDYEGKASDDRGRAYEFAPVFSNLWTLTVVVVTAGSLLVLWEYDVTPLLGAAGIGGIALGIAAKESVGNFLGGLSLYVDDTYTIGDYLELDGGLAGTVIAVGVRSTTLRTRDNIEINVPNSMLNEDRVINRSAPHRKTRLTIDVDVAYGTDIDLVEEILVTIAEEEPLVLSEPKPQTRFLAFGDSALDYELQCWIAAPEQAKRARHEVNREVYTRFQEHDIEIPYTTHDVNLHTAADDPRLTEPDRRN